MAKFVDILPPLDRWQRGVKTRRLNVHCVAAYDIRERAPGDADVVIDLYASLDAAIAHNPVRTLAGFEVKAFLESVGALPKAGLPTLSDDQFPLAMQSTATGSLWFDSKGLLVGRVVKNPSVRQFHTVIAYLMGVELGEFNSVKAAEDYLLKCAHAGRKEQS